MFWKSWNGWRGTKLSHRDTTTKVASVEIFV
jgi:hypothetical protein